MPNCYIASVGGNLLQSTMSANTEKKKASSPVNHVYTYTYTHEKFNDFAIRSYCGVMHCIGCIFQLVATLSATAGDQEMGMYMAAPLYLTHPH